MALFAIIGGSILKGSGIDALWNGAAFVIVVLGTLAAALIQARTPVFLHGMKLFPWVFRAPGISAQTTIEKIVGWSRVARKEGLLGLESVTAEESDDFLRKGLEMLVDGTEPEIMRSNLELDLESREFHDNQGAKVFESMGIYAPTLGIIGAVMGLIAVMQNLADPDALGAGIATAFVATIYGIASANLFFLPVGNKLKAIVKVHSTHREMIIEGLILIAQGENPVRIESKLQGFGC